MKTVIRQFKKTAGVLNPILLYLLFLIPATSHATSVQTILDKTATYLSGPLARSLGILVLMVLGYLCLVQQKFPKEQFAMMLVGLGIIFGGSSLYGLLVG